MKTFSNIFPNTLDNIYMNMMHYILCITRVGKLVLKHICGVFKAPVLTKCFKRKIPRYVCQGTNKKERERDKRLEIFYKLL